MGIILSSTGLPLLTSARLVACRKGAPGTVTPKPTEPPAPGGDVIDLGKPVSQFSYRGVTVNLSRPLPVYYTATGDPVIIAERESSITSLTPASAVASSFRGWGAMINPIDPDYSLGQGFDEIIATTARGSSLDYFYSSARNVDPGSTGSPITIKKGDAFSIVKSVRVSDTVTGSTWKPVAKYVVITVMPSPPPRAGTWFRPSVSNPAKAWEHRVEDLNFSAIRDLPAPSGLSSCATYLAEIRSQEMLTLPSWQDPGDIGRRSQLAGETIAPTGYSRDYGRRRAQYALALHIDPARDQAAIDARRELAIVLTQWGIDIDGAAIAGERQSSGAGQYYGYIEFPYLAAFLTRDAAMLARVRGIRANSIGQCFWVTREVGFPVRHDIGTGGNGRKQVGETYQVEDVDIPEWTHTGWDAYDQNATSLVGLNEIANASLYGIYRDGAFTTQVYEVMAIGLLRNGPGGETGDAAVRNGSYGPSTIRSAAIAYMDRSVTFVPWKQFGDTGHTTDTLALYTAWRDYIPQPKWLGRPDIPQTIDLPEFSAGAGSGRIAFDCAGIHYSTEPITGRDISYSQDNRQFFTISGVGTTHILTGLRPGTQHWCRWRQTSASGSSKWSPTWAMSLPTGQNVDPKYKVDRGRVTTPGTVSGTLTNTVAPAVLHKPYPNHEMPYYEPVKDATEVKTFYAGTGYWTGGTGSLTATYQWQRSTSGGFVNISGETGESYVRTAADSGASIRCVVTVNGKAANTNPVSIPAAPSWPSTTLIDTTFGGALPFEWPSFWAALQAADAASGGIELIHLEGVKLEPAVTRGMLRVRKTGSYPTLNVPIAPNAPAGTYEWEVEIGGGYFPTSWNDKITGDIHFKLRDASGAVRGDATLTIKKEDVPTTISARGTFTISGADKSVHLYVIGDVGTGGTASALGGPVLSKLKIWQP